MRCARLFGVGEALMLAASEARRAIEVLMLKGWRLGGMNGRCKLWMKVASLSDAERKLKAMGS